MAFDSTSPNYPTQSGESAMNAILENFLQLRKLESGSSAPSNAVAGMLWYDTGNGLIKQRNSANNAWITLFEQDSHYPSFPSGTSMVFYLASAPTGWTQDTTHNDKALRVVSGSGGGSGGSLALSSTITGSHTLLSTQVPTSIPVKGGSYAHVVSNVGDAPFYLDSAGGGGYHQHSLALTYVDLIIATKD